MTRKLDRQRPIIESLEPRILMSADFPGLDVPHIDPDDPFNANVDQILARAEEAFLAAAEADAANADEPQQHAADPARVDDPDTALLANETPDDSRQELIIVDPSVPDYELLLADVSAVGGDDTRLNVVMLDPYRSGIEQISEILASRNDFGAIHLISHGGDGEIRLGTDVLDLAMLQRNEDGVQAWGDALSADADILIYGCNLAATDAGEALVEALATATDADVAASDDLTGNAEQGGDWDLEYRVGDIDTAVPFVLPQFSHWQGTLDITSNLVGHYAFEENGGATLTDSSGNQDGTFGNAASWTADSAVGSYALDFGGDSAGSTSLVAVADNAAQDFGSGDWTVAFWYNLNGDPTGSVRFIGDYDDIGEQTGFLVYGSGSTITLNLEDGFSFSSSDRTGTFNGSWQHVALTFDSAANSVDWHLNGSAAGSMAWTGGSISTSDLLRIGGSSSSTGDYEGKIDDVRLYTRELSPTDVDDLVALGPAVSGPPSGYSDPSGSDNSNEWITNVTYAGINNTTGADTNAYGNYTAEVATVTRGDSNQLSVSMVEDNDNSISAWIDWNQDGDFDDAGEEYIVASGENSPGPHTFDVTTPGSATLGTTVMRVGMTFGGAPSADGGQTYGEWEDYSVTVSNAGAQTFTVINTNDSGTGSLRWAIEQANANNGADTIDFDIAGTGVHTISVTTDLPSIDEAVVIDGMSEPDYVSSPVIEIDFSNSNDGFQLLADNVTIRGLAIHSYAADGIIAFVGTGSVFEYNYIGTDASGILDLGSGDDGIDVRDGAHTIRNNVIVGNNGNGIEVYTDGSTITGNYIGIDPTGTFAIGNNNDGISLSASNVTVSNNVISGNVVDGIDLFGGDGNIVRDNLIGTTSDGLTNLGMGGDGVSVRGGATNTQILDNLISFTGLVGIEIDSAGSGTIIQGNTIGTDATGTLDWGSAEHGILIENGSDNVTIGGIGAGEGNMIAFNSFAGIQVEDGSTGASIRGNSIYSNDGIGIDLTAGVVADGLTANDAGDADTGANNLQNWAVLSSAAIADDGTFGYDIDTTTLAAGTYIIDFYASSDSDGGEVEGERYLGSLTGVANGNGSLTGTLAGITLAPGEYVTLVTTDSSGNSSEFSNYAVATDNGAGGTAQSDLQAISTAGGGLALNQGGGNDAYLQADASPFSGQSELTIEVEFSVSSPATGMTTLFSYTDTGNQDELYLGIDTDGEIYLRTSENGGAGYGSITNAVQLFDGEIHTVSVTWENTGGVLMFYVDGEQLGVGRNDYQKGTTIDAGGSLVIGQHQTVPGSMFDADDTFAGTIHNARLFDQVRTQAEISASYRTSLPHDETGMLAQWTFDNLSADGVITESVSGNNLTVEHTGESGFTANSPDLTLAVDEHALDGTVIGQVSGFDAEREAQIVSLLVADPDLLYSAETGKFYKAVAGNFDFATSQTSAESMALDGVNGQLAVIRSATENALLTDFANAQTSGDSVWLGGTDATVEGEWRWIEEGSEADLFWNGAVDGYAVASYTNWVSASQPNNAGGDEDGIRLLSTDGQWYDAPLTQPLSYLVEWDADVVLDATQALTYSIQSQTVAGAFTIDADTGQITVADGSLLDYETDATHSLTVRTTDVDSNTYDEVFAVSLNDLAESNNAPTGLSSGIELNTDGGNDASLEQTTVDLIGGLTAITLETSFRVDQVNGDKVALLDFSHSAGIDDELMVRLNATGEIEIAVADSYATTSQQFLSLVDGQPHHLALTWDSSGGNWAVYVDGEFEESGTGLVNGHTFAAGTDLSIGQTVDDAGDSDASRSFSGAFYDVRVWNEVRSEAEIALNHQHKLDSGNLPSGLVANWQMDGFNGSNQVVDVVSGNNLSIGHATGAGYNASTPVDDLHVSENANNGDTVGFVAPTDPDAPQDIVTDGLFLGAGDQGTSPGYTRYNSTGADAGSVLGDWTVISGDVDTFTRDWTDAPNDGIVVDLNGSTTGAIQQTLSVEDGRQYQILFSMSGDFDVTNQPSSLRVSADGQSQDFVMDEPANFVWGSSSAFNQYSMTFTAEGNSADIAFQSLDTGSSGPYVTSIQVMEIPQAINTILNNDPTLDYDAATGKFYRHVGSATNWNDALTSAAGAQLNGTGGSLVSIKSAYENSVVHQILQDSGWGTTWLGGSDQGVEGDWRWYDGTTQGELFWQGDGTGSAQNGNYANFRAAQPDDLGGADTLHMGAGDGMWDDGGSDTSYIIEWDANEVISSFTFSLTDDSDGRFAIDSNTGEITVADSYRLDFESATSHNVTVEVTDASGNIYNEVMLISVDDAVDLGDNAPTDLSSGIELNSDGGNDAYLSVGDPAVFDGLDELSFEVTFSGLTSVDTQATIYSHSDPGVSSSSFAIFADGTLDLDGISTAGTYAQLLDGEMHHVAFGWDASAGVIQFYVDGEFAEAVAAPTFASFESGGMLVVGQHIDHGDGSFDPSESFSGTIHDLRVWDEVRSEADIALNYQDKFASGSLPSGLIANWQMDGFNGSNEVVDIVSGNNLSIGHATGAGFSTSTPVEDLHISENANNEATVGYVVPTDPDVPQDVVNDGQFLKGDTGAWQDHTVGQTFGDWTVESGAVSHTSQYISSNGGVGLELQRVDGDFPSAITQTLTTEVGRQYQIVFGMTGNFSGGDAIKYLTVSASGESMDFQVEQTAGSGTVYEGRSLTFTADSASTVLRFASGADDGWGAVISDVQVIEIPQAISTILNNDPTLSYDAATDKFYRHVNTPSNFDTAIGIATSSALNGVNGQLLRVDSDYENELFRSLVVSTGNQIWLGAEDDNLDGNWNWLEGSTPDDQFWTGGDTGNALNSKYASEMYLSEAVNETRIRLISDGAWSDNSPLSSYAYVVEWDASEVLSNFTFSLIDDAGGRFAIDSNTGEVTVGDGSLLDYETATTHAIDVQVTDAAGNSYSETMSIMVDNELDANQTVPAAQSIDEDTTLTFTSGTATEVSVTDSLGGTDSRMRVTLSVDDGVLNLSQTTGLTFIEGTDNSGNLVIDGTESDINAALDGMTFTPNENFAGSVTLSMATVLAADLDGHYTFETDASDQSAGTVQDGALSGNAAIVNDAEQGQVLSLDGDGDYVQINGLIGEPANVTLSAWINAESVDVSGGVVISMGTSPALYLHADGTLIGYYESGGANNVVQSTESLVGTGWRHVAVSIDAANSMTIYIDGEAVGTTTPVGAIEYDNSPDSYIGRAGDGGGGFDFDGKIDEARIYSRALSYDEIAALAADSTTSSDSVAITVDPVNDPPAIAQLTDDAVAAYDFENGTDSIASGGPAITVNSPVTIDASAGYTTGSSGLLFPTGDVDSSTNPVSIGTIPGVGSSGEFSFGAQVRFDAGSGNRDWERIIDFGGGGTDNNVILTRWGTSDDLSLYVRNGTTITGSITIGNALSGIEGQWHHYGVTIDSAGLTRLFIDGVLVGSTDVSATPDYSVWDENYIGTSFSSGDKRFQGAMDDIGIFDRAVTASEMASLANTSTPQKFTVLENAIAETAVGFVHGGDVDGDSLTYTILSQEHAGAFAVSSAGEITVADGSLLDHESDTSHDVVVRVFDGSLTYDETVTISLTDTAEAEHTVPGSQSVDEDTSLTFVNGTATEVSVNDTLAGDNPMQVTLSVNDGVLNLSGLIGITIVEGADGSDTITINGTESDINTALNNMTFTPDADFSGSVTLNMTSAIAADLAGRYTFEGNADDVAAGITNDGTLTNGALIVTDPDRGQVLSLNNSDQYVEIPDMFGNPADVTLAAWVNVSSGSFADEVISLGDNAVLRSTDTGNGLLFIINGTSGWQVVDSNVNISGDGWTHVAATLNDTTGAISIYVNGVEVATDTATESILYNQGTVTRIGQNGNGNAHSFEGLIDDARIYTRALSADEIGALATDQAERIDSVAITVAPVNDAPIDISVDNQVHDAADNAIVVIGSQTGSQDTSATLSSGRTVSVSVNGDHIDGEVFDSSGNSLTGQYQIFDGKTYAGFGFTNAENPVVAALPNGGFVVVSQIEGYVQNGSYGTAIILLAFDANGNEVDVSPATSQGPILVSNTTGGGASQITPTVDVAGDGAITVSWDNTTAGQFEERTFRIYGPDVAENAATGTVVATLSGVDPDGDALTYSIVGGDSDFEIVGNEVRVESGSTLDYETNPTRTITIRADDANGGMFDEDVTIQVTDVNEAPVAVDDPTEFANQVLAQNPVGYWQFGESSGTTATNLGSSGVDGTYNGPTLGASGYPGGGSDTGAQFDGTSAYVDMGTFDVSGTGVTLSAWINADDFVANADHRIISKASSTGQLAGDHWWMLSTEDVAGENHLRFRVMAGGTTSTLLASTVDLPTEEWQFATATYDAASGSMKIYLNGTEIASRSHAVGGAVDTDATKSVWVGANPNSAGYFEGQIDEVAVFEQALTATQIQNMYAAGIGGYAATEATALVVSVADGVLANDSDPENDTITAELVTGPSNASAFNLSADGSFTYTGSMGFSGTDTFVYRVFDGTTYSNNATATIEVAAVNDAPVITELDGDTLSYDEGDGPVVVDQGTAATVTDVDSADFAGGNLTISSGTLGDNSEDQLSIRNQGTGAGEIGFDGTNVTYQNVLIGTASGGSNGADLVIMLNASTDKAAVSALTQNVTYENSDTSNPTEDDRTISFTVNDGDGGTSVSSDVTISVNRVNDAPQNGLQATQSVAEDGTLVFSPGNGNAISVNDIDSGTSDIRVTLTVTNGVFNLAGTTGLTSASGNGTTTVTIEGPNSAIYAALNGSSYVPTADYNGSATLTMATDDLGNTGIGGSQTDTDVMNITVTPDNDVPVNTVPGAQTVNEDTPINISGIAVNDTDGDLSTVQLSVTQGTVAVTLSGAASVSAGANSSNTLTLSGTQADINATLASLNYQGNLNYNGADTLTILSTDSNSATDSDTVTITVDPVDDGAVITGDTSFSGNEGDAVPGDLNATDVDGLTDGTYFSVTAAATNGTAAIDPASGAWTFTPTDPNWFGTDNFTVTVTDDEGGTTDQLVSITLANVDDGAVITGDTSFSGNEGDAVSGDLNATDVDGLTDGTYFSVTAAASNGTAAIDPASGAWTFTPTDPNWFGTDNFTVTVTDDEGGTTDQVVSITLANVDDGAVITGDTSFSGNEGDAVSGDLNATDVDGLTDGTYFSVTAAATNGTAVIDPVSGAWTFTPTDPNWFGTDNFTVTVKDDEGGTTDQVVSITLANVDDGAVITGETSFSGNEGDAVSGDLNATDVDGLTDGTYFTVSAAATNGTAAIDPASGAWTFTPTDPNWFGTDNFTVTVTDDEGGTTDQVVSITLANVDDGAVITGDTSFSGNEGDAVSGDLNATDVDGLTDGTYFTVSAAATNGTAAIDPASGAWTFTPTDPNWFGTDNFTVTVTDDEGGTTDQVVSITLANVDDGAVITGDTSFSGNEGDAVSGDLNATDVDGLTDGTYFSVTAAATNGTAAIDPASGAWTFTPTDPNWFGSDAFTVTVTDDEGGTTDQVVSITLANVDDPAVITGDTSYSGNEGDAVSGDLNATDVDGLTDGTYFTVSAAATNGTAAIDPASGAWTFTPTDPNWFGSDAFTVTVTDDEGGTTDQVVSIMLANVDDGAVISGDISFSGNEGDAVGGTMGATDVDGLTDGTYFTVSAAATNGTAAIDPASGAWTFTPTDPNWFGTDNFTVTVTDDEGGTTDQVVSITLANVDDGAVISGDISFTGNEGDSVGGTMGATDVDGLTDGTYFTVSAAATNGTAAIDPASGAWTFTPTDPNWFGTDNFTVTVTDDEGGTTDQVVSITLANVDDGAVITGDTSFSGNEGDAVSGDLNATDVDGLTDGTYFSVTAAASNGTAAIDPASGAWTFTPTDPNWFGTDNFTVTVTDDEGGTTDQLVSITLANVDDGAVITGDTSFSGNESDAVSGDLNATDVDGLTDGTYFSVTAAATNGTAAIDPASGAWTFTPTDANWFGTDNFTVTVTDDEGGTTDQVVSITLANVDDGAVISGDISFTGNEGDTVGGTMGATDVDGLTDGTYFSVTAAATNGTAAIDPASGAWTFTPTDPSWHGSDAFTVTVTDDLGGTTTQVVNITLANVGDGAVISGDISYSGNQGDAVSGDLNATDADGLTDGTYFSVTAAASNGVAAIDPTSGTWTFIPTDPNWHGSDAFVVTVTDDLGGTTTQVVSITLTNVDDIPVIAGTSTGIVVEDQDPDADGLLETAGALSVSDPDPGESGFIAGTVAGSHGHLIINATGSWSYEADNTQASLQQLDAGESINDILTVTTLDGTSHNVTITIHGSEDAAVVSGDIAGSVDEDGVLVASGTLAISDVDSADNPVSFPDGASTAGDNGYGDFRLVGGSWSYTLNDTHAAVQALGAGDSLTDTHTFVASDSSTQVVTITIAGADEAPVPEVEPTIPIPASEPVDPAIPPSVPENPTDSPGGEFSEVGTSATTSGADPSTVEPETPTGLSVSLLNPLQPDEVFLSVIADMQPQDAPGVRDISAPAVKPDAGSAQAFLQELKSFWKDDSAEASIEFSDVRFNQEFWNGLDKVASDLEESVEEQEKKMQLSAEAAAGVGISLTAGFVSWALRGGAMAASLLAWMPAWRHFDPLPVLGQDKARKTAALSDAEERDPDDDERDTKVDELFDRR